MGKMIVDKYVDLTYGILLFTGMASMIGLSERLPAVTFGVGIMLGYAVHVGWRIARFDPRVTSKVEEVGEAIGEIDDKVESVESKVDSVDKVEETVDKVESTVDSVEETVETIADE